MPSYDQCHEQVMRALQKDGWLVDKQQVRVTVGRRNVFVDLRATRSSNGSRQQVLLIEIKCFSDPQTILHELYTAIGQYILYRAMLAERGSDIPLYLSVPESIFQTSFDAPVRRAIQDSRIKLVIINLIAEEVVRWIEWQN